MKDRNLIFTIKPLGNDNDPAEKEAGSSSLLLLMMMMSARSMIR
jgi:hypothetical protein